MVKNKSFLISLLLGSVLMGSFVVAENGAIEPNLLVHWRYVIGVFLVAVIGIYVGLKLINKKSKEKDSEEIV